MGYLIANLYPLLLLGLILGIVIGWFACEGKSSQSSK
jgi:hypothetical protein